MRRKHFWLVLLLFSLVLTVGAQNPSSTPKIEGRVQYLEAQVSTFSKGQDNLVAMLANQTATIRSLIIIFGFIISLFYGLTTYLQYRKDLRETGENQEKFKFIKDQGEMYISRLDNSESKTEVILTSAKANIDQITSLLKTLQEMFKFSQEAEQMRKDAEDLRREIESARHEAELEKENNQTRLRTSLVEINRKAINISKDLTRDNYKSNYNRHRLENFSNEAQSRIHMEGQEQLNGNCNLLFGLSFVIEEQYKDALNQFSESIRKAELYAVQAAPEWVYPDLESQGIVKEWNRKLANIAYYHKAIIQYNLGGHEKAEKLFVKALEYDKDDVDSMIYIPESKFLGSHDSLENIIREFDKVKGIVESHTNAAKWRKRRERIVAEIAIKKGNCFFPSSEHEKFRNSQNLKKAEACYEEALGLDPDFYLAKFSLAQALAKKASRGISPIEKNEAIAHAQRLFNEVFEEVRSKIGRVTETKILIMLNFILLICGLIVIMPTNTLKKPRFSTHATPATGRK